MTTAPVTSTVEPAAVRTSCGCATVRRRRCRCCAGRLTACGAGAAAGRPPSVSTCNDHRSATSSCRQRRVGPAPTSQSAAGSPPAPSSATAEPAPQPAAPPPPRQPPAAAAGPAPGAARVAAGVAVGAGHRHQLAADRTGPQPRRHRRGAVAGRPGLQARLVPEFAEPRHARARRSSWGTSIPGNSARASSTPCRTCSRATPSRSTRADGTVAEFSIDSVQTVQKSDFPDPRGLRESRPLRAAVDHLRRRIRPGRPQLRIEHHRLRVA